MSDSKAHPDAFCFYDYKHPRTGVTETIYNASTRKAPSFAPELDTGERLERDDSSRRYAPTHVPSLGDRVWVTMTAPTAHLEALTLASAGVERYGEAFKARFDTYEDAVQSAYEHLMDKAVEPVISSSAVIEQLTSTRTQTPPPSEDPLASPEYAEEARQSRMPFGALLSAFTPSPELLEALQDVRGLLEGLVPAFPHLIRSGGTRGLYDRQGQPIPVHEWIARVQHESQRLVAWDELPNSQLHISTVWLGVDHRIDDSVGAPLIFETKVFGPDRVSVDEYTRRYSTEADAHAGHAETVLALKSKHTEPV